MSAPPLQQTELPIHRMPGVRMAFSVGMALGFLFTFSGLFIVSKYIASGEGGEGLNRADVVETNGGGRIVIPASACDTSRALGGIADASDPVRFRVSLIRVVDGDTIRVLWHGENISVRLLGIDAPERNHPGGKEATECLRGLLAGAEAADLEFENNRPRRDSLGRLLAYMWRGDMLLNLKMVKSGHAGLYKNGGKGVHGDALRNAARNHTGNHPSK